MSTRIILLISTLLILFSFFTLTQSTVYHTHELTVLIKQKETLVDDPMIPNITWHITVDTEEKSATLTLLNNGTTHVNVKGSCLFTALYTGDANLARGKHEEFNLGYFFPRRREYQQQVYPAQERYTMQLASKGTGPRHLVDIDGNHVVTVDIRVDNINFVMD
eukprot:CAMPEP_0117445450 /NCGR_PEP_ID=MMETSP0759-20121206/5803_1 /TAXON_ID=63605 /ORGANISM="Percolomonas cosmopolitus, Strain WS" /LENGTH=162 /DNA_ID=CAMNT_0005237629 /DNA_START=11 /DNA_END=499 /DNA_ORIENTATION=-